MNRIPGLRRGVRVTFDAVRDTHVVLYPEGVLLLNETACDVLARCDGRRTVAQIATDLAEVYDEVPVDSVVELVDDLAARRILVTDGTGAPADLAPAAAWGAAAPRDPVPVGLLAELTYRCPLRCTYCSNPVQLAGYADELDTARWCDVFDRAREMGVLQLHLSGGEPMLRPDLAQLVAHASQRGLYTNLITSGIPLPEPRLAALVAAGLDHIQLSIQDTDPVAAETVAGIRAHGRKVEAAALIRKHGLPMTVNVVLHAGNVDRLPAIAAFAVNLGADRIELAHTQYYGWGLRNRAALMPTAAQVAAAAAAATEIHRRYAGTVEIVYVQPDYHTGTPKPCMRGWGSRQLVVAPNGDVLPCLAAAQLPGMEVPSVRRESLAAIWYDSAAFNRFRGTDWMPQPCRDCALRDIDFGGCRCQAYQLTGDPAATDPVCTLSPHHDTVTKLLNGGREPAVPRRYRTTGRPSTSLP